MKIILGLGNPGKEYVLTRHNIGFMVVQALAGAWDMRFEDKTKFKALVAQAEIDNEKILLVKPLTFYNNVGECARAILDFYKLTTTDFLVVHDDMALPFGTLRTRFSGRDAGNNGVKSLNQHLGEDYARLRVGIWDELRENVDATDFVLGKFSADDEETIKRTIIPAAVEIAMSHIKGELEAHSLK